MGKLAKGLTWRFRPDGTKHENIYFDTTYRGHQLRDCAGTPDPDEAERRLRKRKAEIDNAEIYGIRPEWTFSQAAAKYITEYPEAERYLSHLDSMMTFVGGQTLRTMHKDTFKPWIQHRYKEGVSVRTINWGLEVARRILRLSAYHWRDDNGLSWIDNAPIIPFEKGQRLQPYPLSWDQQDRLFSRLTERMRDMCLFKVNTGCREQEVIQLEWAWERDVGIGETVFLVPGEFTKNGKPHYVVLNSLARMVVEKWRGRHGKHVFGEPMAGMTNKIWQDAWRMEIGPVPGFRKGVHNLKHTFGKRLRDAGVDERDVGDLLHHMPKTITRHYSQPELKHLRQCVEKIVRKPHLKAVI